MRNIRVFYLKNFQFLEVNFSIYILIGKFSTTPKYFIKFFFKLFFSLIGRCGPDFELLVRPFLDLEFPCAKPTPRL